MDTQSRSFPHLKPQTAQILLHLIRVGSISPLEAGALYRCRSLSRRICDLKEAGFEIETELRKDATGQRYARYSMPKRDRRSLARFFDVSLL